MLAQGQLVLRLLMNMTEDGILLAILDLGMQEISKVLINRRHPSGRISNQ